METTKLHPIIWIRTVQGVFIKQISDFEELQLFMKENNISDYFRLESEIKIDGIIYIVKKIKFCLITPEDLRYIDGTAYNLSLDVMVE